MNAFEVATQKILRLEKVAEERGLSDSAEFWRGALARSESENERLRELLRTIRREGYHRGLSDRVYEATH